MIISKMCRTDLRWVAKYRNFGKIVTKYRRVRPGIKKPWSREPLSGLDFSNIQTDQKHTIFELTKASLSPFFTSRKILAPGAGCLSVTLYSTTGVPGGTFTVLECPAY
jgi:hypothetical protein